MSQEIINIGPMPNDGQGDPLRVAFAKINNNFSNLFYTSTQTIESITTGVTANQIIWEGPVSQFAQGQFQVRSGNPSNQDSQDIMISAQITNDLSSVKWTGYATTFNGNATSTYDMDVYSSNVRLLSTPLTSDVLQHFIAFTVTYVNVTDTPLLMELDGYAPNSIMSTENVINMSTE